MSAAYFFKYILVMAGVTYLIRMVPYIAFRKKIQNIYIRSFLYYIPYAVLGSMTFPAIFYSTDSMVCSTCGCLVAIVLAWFNKGLLTVAVCASLAVFFSRLF